MSYPTAPPSYTAEDENKGKSSGGPPYPYPEPTSQYGTLSTTGAPYPPQPGYPPAVGSTPYPQGSNAVQPSPYGYPPQPPIGTAQHYNADTDGVYISPTGQSTDAAAAENGGFTTGDSLSDKNVRRLFIRKVFIVFGIQLLVTFGIITIFTMVDSVSEWVRKNAGFYYASYFVFLFLLIALSCVESLRRKSPHNLISLGILTLALSYMAGTIAAFYKTEAVMVTMGVTVLVCGGIILFSMQTRFDFTQCTGVIFVLCMVLLTFGFISIFTYDEDYYLDIVYGCLAALLMGIFLAFDVQLVMGGKRYQLDPEEYVFGALNIYIDVVYIFILLLSLFGKSNG